VVVESLEQTGACEQQESASATRENGRLVANQETTGGPSQLRTQRDSEGGPWMRTSIRGYWPRGSPSGTDDSRLAFGEPRITMAPLGVVSTVVVAPVQSEGRAPNYCAG